MRGDSRWLRGDQRQISKEMPTRHWDEEMKGPMRPCGHVALRVFVFNERPSSIFITKGNRSVERGKLKLDGESRDGDGRTLVLRSGRGLESLQEQEATREDSDC